MYHPNRCRPCQIVQLLSNGRVVKTFVEAVGIVCHAAVAGWPSGYVGKAKSLTPRLLQTRLAGATIGTLVEPNAKGQWFNPRSSNFHIAFAQLSSGTSTTATIARCSSKAKRAAFLSGIQRLSMLRLEGAIDPNLAKVGVEGSNPFARSKFLQRNQLPRSGPSGPCLLT